MMRIEFKKFNDIIKTIPEVFVNFPRDGEIMNRSIDLLFIARVMVSWHKDYVGICLCKSKKGYYYCFENKKGDCFSLFSGEAIPFSEKLDIRKRLKNPDFEFELIQCLTRIQKVNSKMKFD